MNSSRKSAHTRAIWWFVDGDRWTQGLVEALDHCLDRMVFFGRAETLTLMRRTTGQTRHRLRGGKPRDSESLATQVQRELALRGVPDADQVSVEEMSDATWVAVHIPLRKATAQGFGGDRRGHWVRLTFPGPIAGPLRLGHSSSFGLGMFVPRP